MAIKKRLEQAALIYATRFKWAVIPIHSINDGCCTCQKSDCHCPGKHPLTKNGVKDASLDTKIISEWWGRRPFANIGIATGAESGFFVLDVDGQSGAESLQEIEEQYGKLPNTVEAITGGGGRHILFRYPFDMVIGNKVALAPGLDIRGHGGYIVAPPSVHISGKQYHWEASSRPGEAELAEAPGWVLAMLAKDRPQGMSRSGEDWRQLVSAGVAEGQRNSTIAALAGHLLRRYIDPYIVIELLKSWNSSHCKPPLQGEEVYAAIESIAKLEAYRRGLVK